jgi:phosphate uptake regulator
MLHEIASGPAAESRDASRDVDALERAIEALVIERQGLREVGGRRPVLEQNCRALVALQWQLSRTRIDDHLTSDHCTAA